MFPRKRGESGCAIAKWQRHRRPSLGEWWEACLAQAGPALICAYRVYRPQAWRRFNGLPAFLGKRLVICTMRSAGLEVKGGLGRKRGGEKARKVRVLFGVWTWTLLTLFDSEGERRTLVLLIDLPEDPAFLPSCAYSSARTGPQVEPRSGLFLPARWPSLGLPGKDCTSGTLAHGLGRWIPLIATPYCVSVFFPVYMTTLMPGEGNSSRFSPNCSRRLKSGSPAV
ncbi:uncharacterized protein CIMG_04583 [Coccidioides immitis RS]|uniref:Uncharacterized protein n=1 Tax=Coccidioides immitis (strain RS) TaxID=246410 RepID=J3KDT5_COCIM|nr:uncharacterized protein CIMG_04583 [Coccidioides immitis RS]EAS33559.3 hypothetical protein CIMG_04583 [Coccidioides immitis RS]